MPRPWSPRLQQHLPDQRKDRAGCQVDHHLRFLYWIRWEPGRSGRSGRSSAEMDGLDQIGASRVKLWNVEKWFLPFKVSNICVWLRKEKICHLALFMNLIRIRSNMIAMQASNLLSRYNDMSPLENHHCAVSFKILSSPECNIFTNLSTEEFKEVKIYHSFSKKRCRAESFQLA